jgi:hypothetical protein
MRKAGFWSNILFLSFFFGSTGVLESLHQAFFVMEFLEKGSHELFAGTGLKLRSS